MAREENDFERRARLGEAAFARRANAPPGNRIVESWWWFALVTLQFWFRVLSWPFQDHRQHGNNVFAMLSLVIVVLGTPAFGYAKRRGRQQRLEQAGGPGSGDAVG